MSHRFERSVAALGHRSSSTERSGFSLLEVIASMVLVGIMMIPLASMMRASAHAWEDAESAGDPAAELRAAASWTQNALRSADRIVDVGTNWIEFERSATRWRLEIRGNQLRMNSRSESLLVADQVSRITCTPRTRRPDNAIYAIDFSLAGVSSSGGSVPTTQCTATLDWPKLP